MNILTKMETTLIFFLLVHPLVGLADLPSSWIDDQYPRLAKKPTAVSKKTGSKKNRTTVRSEVKSTVKPGAKTVAKPGEKKEARRRARKQFWEVSLAPTVDHYFMLGLGKYQPRRQIWEVALTRWPSNFAQQRNSGVSYKVVVSEAQFKIRQFHGDSFNYSYGAALRSIVLNTTPESKLTNLSLMGSVGFRKYLQPYYGGIDLISMFVPVLAMDSSGPRSSDLVENRMGRWLSELHTLFDTPNTIVFTVYAGILF
ncbi:MAG: hypothetical protein CMP10_13125 [Zetaproteobacteria bacterium]|nr:hypothetical protein [Pseudobdellovibrionaceae bacterium]